MSVADSSPSPTPALTFGESVLAFAVFLTLGVGTFFSSIVGNDVFFPLHTDQINPWRADTSAERLEELHAGDNPYMTDKHWLWDPDLRVFHDAVDDRRLPLWNPYIVGGAPYLGQALYGVFYPPHWLTYFFDSGRAYALIAALNIAMAGFFTFVFLRRIGLSRGAALFGGIAFALSAPMAVRSHYFMTVAPVVWLPLLLTVVHEWVAHRKRWALVAIAPIVAASIATGFPQTAIYGVGFGGLWLLTQSWREGLPSLTKRTVLYGAMVGLGIAIAAIQVFPVLVAQAHSVPRIVNPDKLIGQGLVSPTFLMLLTPDLFGHPLWSHDWLNYIRGAALPFMRADNFTEVALYVGLVTIVLALFCPIVGRGQGRWALPTMAAFGFLFAALPVPDQAPSWMERVIHFVAKAAMGDPKRILLPSAFLVCAAAAVSFEGLRHRTRLAWSGPSVLAVAILLVCGSAWYWVHSEGVDGLRTFLHERNEAVHGIEIVEGSSLAMSDEKASAHHDYLLGVLRKATLNALIVAIAFFACWWMSSKRQLRLAMGALTVITLGDLFLMGRDLHRGQDAQGFLSDHPFIARLEEELQSPFGRMARLAVDAEFSPLRSLGLPPNMGTHWHLHDANGYIVQVVSRYAELYSSLEDGIVKAVQVRPFTDVECLKSPVLDVANITLVLTTAPLELPGYELAFHHGRYRAYRNKDALGRVACFGSVESFPRDDDAKGGEEILKRLGAIDVHSTLLIEGESKLSTPTSIEALPKAALRSYAPEEIVVDLTPGADCYLYLADNFYPGWEAEVDGQEAEIVPANRAFRAVYCPAGTKEVIFRYRPTEVTVGLIVSVLGILLTLGLWLAPKRRSPKVDDSSP